MSDSICWYAPSIRFRHQEFLYVAGIYGLSCIIGILAVFAPSGLGVREGIMLLGLGLVMPKEYAVIISIIISDCGRPLRNSF